MFVCMYKYRFGLIFTTNYQPQTFSLQGSKLAHGSVESFSAVMSNELEKLVKESERLDDLLRSVERSVKFIEEINAVTSRITGEVSNYSSNEFHTLR